MPHAHRREFHELLHLTRDTICVSAAAHSDVEKSMKDPAFWGIHVESAAGEYVFLTQGVVAIDWHQLGDIRSVQCVS